MLLLGMSIQPLHFPTRQRPARKRATRAERSAKSATPLLIGARLFPQQDIAMKLLTAFSSALNAENCSQVHGQTARNTRMVFSLETTFSLMEYIIPTKMAYRAVFTLDLSILMALITSQSLACSHQAGLMSTVRGITSCRKPKRQLMVA